MKQHLTPLILSILIGTALLTAPIQASENQDLEKSSPPTTTEETSQDAVNDEKNDSTATEASSNQESQATEDTQKKELIKKILTSTKANDTQAFVKMFNESLAPQLLPMASQFQDGAASLEKAFKKAGEKLASQIIPKIEALYLESFQAFTTAELQTIHDFYSSETGTKFNDTLLSLAPKISGLTADPQAMAPIVQEIMQALTSASSLENKATNPTTTENPPSAEEPKKTPEPIEDKTEDSTNN